LLKVVLIGISSSNQWRIQRFKKKRGGALQKGDTPEIARNSAILGVKSGVLTFDGKFSARRGGGGVSKSATANASMFNVSSILSVYQRCCQLDEKDAILQSYLSAFEEYRVFFFLLNFYRV
jgi:hypothetical protein